MEDKEDGAWTLVRRKKSKSSSKFSHLDTIYVSGIPEKAKAKELWHFFSKAAGKIKDIILPKKRDKNNGRFGFVKV